MQLYIFFTLIHFLTHPSCIASLPPPETLPEKQIQMRSHAQKKEREKKQTQKERKILKIKKSKKKKVQSSKGQ